MLRPGGGMGPAVDRRKSMRFLVMMSAAVVLWAAAPMSEAFAICCGGNCCFIDTVCRSSGDENPDDACQVCDPSSSQTAWTDVAGCGDADAGTMTEEDAGVTEEDAGTTETDAGSTTETDAGTTTPDDDDDDDGCSAAGGGAAGGLWIAMALFARRRRKAA
tara:strand:- start:2782 stop:3264 length:483 start_codon:yes stop_codon:yes gene_type:complete